jgi:(R)-2-hydroxyacyl-CoA dehydratese activating ATPase
MIVAGCDVGSLTAKAVIMEEDDILSQAVMRVRAQPADAARQVMQQALDGTDLTLEDLVCCVGTGYGKDRVPFADRVESEISCHARGAWWRVPSARTIIDIGGQDAKAMRVDADGRVVRYIYNDKCASGTGRFLEVMAEALEVRLEDMGRVGQSARETLAISNQCVIFAETEVVSLVNAGKDVPDIVAALHRAMANRVASLAGSIGVENDIVMTGGVAKNAGVFDALAEGINTVLKPLDGLDPQIVGALGAALFAGEFARDGQ